jgi:hypothetical protein
LLADRVDLHDVRVLQGRDGSCLGLETRPLLRSGVRPGQDHLQRHQAVQAQVAGLVDDAHRAAAQLAQHLVAVNRRQRPGTGGDGVGRPSQAVEPLTRPQGLVHLELKAERVRQLRKAPLILTQFGRFAIFLAQADLIVDEVEQRLGIGPQRGRALQVILDGGALPIAPPPVLVVQQTAGRRGDRGGRLLPARFGVGEVTHRRPHRVRVRA